MAKKIFDPVEETFFQSGSAGGREIVCRLADDGLRITVLTPQNDHSSVRRRQIHLSPARCLEVLGRSAYMDQDDGSVVVRVMGEWGIGVTTFSGPSGVVFDMYTMAKWLDCVAFPEEEDMHRRLWDALRLHRASHLISAPIEKKPDPDPEHIAPGETDEIIEADFVQVEPVATTALVIAEHQGEPAQQESITGLGLRRFVRSGLLFARDVAVDVTSRIVSRSLTGQ